MHIKKFLIAVLLLSGLMSPVYAENEKKFTLTTYYPAPYGDYKQLQSNDLVSGKVIIGDFNADGRFTQADVTTANVPSGGLAIQSSIKIGADNATCTETKQGTMRYNSATNGIEACLKTRTSPSVTWGWQPIGGASSGVKEATLASPGYIEFSNGLMIQWGTCITPRTVIFPKAFTTQVFAVTGSQNMPKVHWYGNEIFFNNVTRTGFIVEHNHVGKDKNVQVYWIAIGK